MRVIKHTQPVSRQMATNCLQRVNASTGDSHIFTQVAVRAEAHLIYVSENNLKIVDTFISEHDWRATKTWKSEPHPVRFIVQDA